MKSLEVSKFKVFEAKKCSSTVSVLQINPKNKTDATLNCSGVVSLMVLGVFVVTSLSNAPSIHLFLSKTARGIFVLHGSNFSLGFRLSLETGHKS